MYTCCATPLFGNAPCYALYSRILKVTEVLTTMIYTHIRNDKVCVNPLDELTKGLMDEGLFNEVPTLGAHNMTDKRVILT